jgi:hypothetical protein
VEERQELTERNDEIRRSARGWRRAGILDGKRLDAILELYPDDRTRVGTAFRALLFVFAMVAAVSALMLFFLAEPPTGLVLVLMAGASVVATEIQVGTYRRTRSGAEEATALLSVLFAAATWGYVVSESGAEDSFAWRSTLFVAAIASVGAVFRWGVPPLAALAAASAFTMLSFWSGARVAWILLALVLLAPLLRGSVSGRLAPSHRMGCDFALVVVLSALYSALHLGSYDLALLESDLFSGWRREAGPPALRSLFIVATASMPVLLLAGGIRLRRPMLLRSGIVFAVASLVTLRFYVHVAPLWVVLLAAGGAAVAVALALHKFLASGPGKERYGFTAEPLFERLTPAAVLEAGMSAALAPAAERGDDDVFRGGGGEFGGGGASGSY